MGNTDVKPSLFVPPGGEGGEPRQSGAPWASEGGGAICEQGREGPPRQSGASCGERGDAVLLKGRRGKRAPKTREKGACGAHGSSSIAGQC